MLYFFKNYFCNIYFPSLGLISKPKPINMKRISLLLLMISSINFCLGQEKPNVTFVSTTNVVGTCNNGSTVSVSYRIKKDPASTDTITIPKIDTTLVKIDNKFNLKFSHPRDVKQIVSVWSDKNTKSSNYIVEDEISIVKKLTENATKSESSYIGELEAINEFNAEKQALKNTTLVYSSTVISTNFSIPLVRFNFVEGDGQKQGDILLFNSIGAGIGIYGGRLERTRDKDGDIINEEFSNRLGASIGAIFSAGTGDDVKNVFAPVLNVALLDFQIGFGVELGQLAPNQKREFVTLSYSIPLYKLLKKSYYLWLNKEKPIESIRKSQQ